MDINNHGHFPVETLKNKVKDLFEYAVSKITHEEALGNGLNRALKFHQTDKPVTESAYISEDSGIHTINTFDNYWQYLCLMNYCLVVINDCGIILANSSTKGTVSLDRASALYEQAHHVWQCALKMILPSKSNPEYMEQARGEIFRLPNSFNSDEYTRYADSITPVFVMRYPNRAWSSF